MATISELMRWITSLIPNTNTSSVNVPQYIESNVEKFRDQPEIANQFKTLWSLGSSLLDDTRENIINAYNVFEESTNPAFRQYMQTSLSQWDKLLSGIDKQRQQVESFYWPWGQAENMINDYIVKYWNRIAQQAAWSQALAKSTWIRSGASQAAVRAWVSQQQALDADNLIKFQEKKVGDLTNLYNTYNTLISQLRAEASWANQQYVIQPLAMMLERQSGIANALVNNEAQLNQMKISLATAWSWSSSSWLWLDGIMSIVNSMIAADPELTFEEAFSKANDFVLWWSTWTWTQIELPQTWTWSIWTGNV